MKTKGTVFSSLARIISLPFIILVIIIVGFTSVTRATTVIWGNGTVTGVTSGSSQSCGITNGQASCWGNNDSGQLGNNSTVSSIAPVVVNASGVLSGKTVTAISAGNSFTCAIASGAAYCWGMNTFGQLGNNSKTNSSVPVAVDTSGVLSGKTVTAISAGDTQTCAVASGAAYCWGYNNDGQLGNAAPTTSMVPIAVNSSGVLSGKTVTSISVGYLFSCAVASGAAYCWGFNGYNELGNNSTTLSNVPVAVNSSGVLSGKTVTSISAGEFQACVLASGAAYCWGRNSNGQLGNGTTTQAAVPVAVKATGALSGLSVTQISSGGSTTCAVATSRAFCWGLNTNGQVGDNTLTQRTSPVAVYPTGILDPGGGTTVTQVNVGTSQVCVAATTTSGRVSSNNAACWGLNTNGQLGNNSTTQSLVPVWVLVRLSSTSDNYRFFASSTMTTPGTPLAAMNQSVNVPAGVVSVPSFASISAGDGYGIYGSGTNSACAVASSAAYCWGNGTYGQLGNNTTTNSSVPVAVDTSGVLASKTVTAVATGNHFACAIANGSVYCWGYNTDGELGNNSTTNSSVPVAVDTSGVLSGKTVTSIAAGNEVVCAIASGAAYCWGNGASGDLGNNSTTNSSVPVAVNTSGVLAGKTVAKISIGYNTSCVIANSAAYCWGGNTYGGLGNNSTTDSSVPVAVDTSGVLSGKTATSVSVGSITSCAVANSAAYCWGSGTSGALGDNSTTNSSVPVAVDTSGVLSGKTVTTIASGVTFTCVIANSAAYCWGGNTHGGLGNNSTTDSSVPVAVDTSGVLAGKTVNAVTLGDSYACAIASNAAYCWGLNADGQLGNNSTAQSSVPVAVQPSPPGPPAPGQPNSFRLRVGIKQDTTVPASSVSFQLQYAKKTAVTCSAQSTGYALVTDSTPIAWYNTGSPTTGTAISSSVNDPTYGGTVVYQNFVSEGPVFNNPNAIPGGQYGVWDLALQNLSPDSSSYCLQVQYSDGTALETYNQFPEIDAQPSVPSIGFVNSDGSPVTLPVFNMSTANVLSTCQTSTGTLGSASTQRLRITQTGSPGSGWNIAIAPSLGDTATWYDSAGGNNYSFNDSSGSPAGCAVGGTSTYAGQLTVKQSTSTLVPQTGCATTGLSLGSGSTAFVNGTTSAITLLSSSSASSMGCYWDMYGAGLSQTIPPTQPHGNYTINLTATVTAS